MMQIYLKMEDKIKKEEERKWKRSLLSIMQDIWFVKMNLKWNVSNISNFSHCSCQ